MRPLYSFVAAAFGGGMVAVAASAATITYNVDFNTSGGPAGTYSGTGPSGTGGTWNGFTIGASGAGLVASATSGTLVSSSGQTSGITVTLGNFNAYDANVDNSGTGPLVNDFAYQPTLGPTSAASTFSINNLNPTSTYTLYLVAQNATFNETATVFTIGTDTETATNNGSAAFTQNANYVLYSSLTAPNGTISGTFNDAKAADNAAFNGFQLVETTAATPEPASLSLLGVAGLSLLSRRRRI